MRKVLLVASLALVSIASPVMAQELTQPVFSHRMQMMDAIQNPDPTVGHAACEEWMGRSDLQFAQDYADVTFDIDGLDDSLVQLSVGNTTYGLLLAAHAATTMQHVRQNLHDIDMLIGSVCQAITRR